MPMLLLLQHSLMQQDDKKVEQVDAEEELHKSMGGMQLAGDDIEGL